MGKTLQQEKLITDNFTTYNFQNEKGVINSVINELPISFDNKTFPSIYYNQKELTQCNREALVEKFIKIINS